MPHPLTRLLFDEMRARHVSVAVMAKKSGIHRETIYRWARADGKSGPSVVNIEACFNVLGLKIVATELVKIYASRVRGVGEASEARGTA